MAKRILMAYCPACGTKATFKGISFSFHELTLFSKCDGCQRYVRQYYGENVIYSSKDAGGHNVYFKQGLTAEEVVCKAERKSSFDVHGGDWEEIILPCL